jgi:hypothetical protein
MRQKKKTPLSELLNIINNDEFGNEEPSTYYGKKYKDAISKAKPDESEEEFVERLKIKTGNYSLRR